VIKKFLLCTFLCIAPLARAAFTYDGFIPTPASGVQPSPKANDPEVQRPGQRVFSIYLPEEYASNPTKNYPVVYFMHGLGGDFQTAEAMLPMLNTLIERGQIMPMIVIGMDASTPPIFTGLDPDGTWYINSTFVNNGQFEDYIFNQLIPYVEANYRTLTDYTSRAVMGHSMGGFGALYLGLRHPDKFISIASDSGTPFWAHITNVVSSLIPALKPGTLDPNPDFQYNAVDLPLYQKNVLPECQADTGFVVPGPFTPRDNTNSVITYAEAFSPDAGLPLGVDFPFTTNIVSSKHQLPFVFPNYVMNLDPTIWNLWQQKNTYKLMQDNTGGVQTSAKTQTIYLDGGSKEPINAEGAQVFSALLNTYNIDHEYLLYDGNHVDYIGESSRYDRFGTNMMRISAQFAGTGKTLPDTRIKITGNCTFEFHDTAQFTVSSGTIVGCETPAVPASATNSTWKFYDAAQGLISGVFQIGNQRTKAQETLYAGSIITSSIELDGSDVLFAIQQGGLLGFALGIEGKNSTSSNMWAVSSLLDVTSIELHVKQGTFKHNIILNSDQNSGSLWGMSNTPQYTFELLDSAQFLGGGSIISIDTGYYMHPLVLNMFLSDQTADMTSYYQDTAFNVRSKEVTTDSYDTNIKGFYGVPQTPAQQYVNGTTCGTLCSDYMFTDPSKQAQLQPGNIYSQSQLFTLFDELSYPSQRTKLAAVGTDGTIYVSYLAPVLIANPGFDPFDPDSKEFVYQLEILKQPISSIYHVSRYLDWQKALRTGVVGVQLYTDANNNVRVLWAYDPTPDA